MQIDTEACAQRACEQSCAGGGANQCERVERQLHRTGGGALIYQNINSKIFHRRIEILFDNGVEAVNLIDKKHIVGLKACEDSRKVAWLVEHGARGDFKSHAKFVCHNVGKSGFAQSWRAVEQQVVERLAAHFGGLHKNFQVLKNTRLSVEVVERERPQLVFVLFVRYYSGILPYVKTFVHRRQDSGKLGNGRRKISARHFF